MTDTLINIGMYVAYALAILGVAAAIGFSIYQFIGNIKQSKTALFGIIGLVVIFIIAYVTASGTDVSEAVFEKVGTDYGASKMIGAGMNAFYILFGITVIALIASEIARPFKK